MTNRIIKNQWFGVALILMTFSDSYKIFPSAYRPLFLYVLLLLFPLALLNKVKFQKGTLFILLSFLYMTGQGFILGIFRYSNFRGVLDYVISVILFFISYISYVYIFDRLEIKKIKKAIEYVGNFLIILGSIELLSYYQLIPKLIKYYLNIVFTGNYLNRFKLISSEASWATMTLLFFLVFYLTYNKKIKAVLIMSLIILSFSTQGILCMLIYIGVFIIKKYRKKSFKYFLILFILSFIILILLKNFLIMFNMQNQYFARRLFVLNNIRIQEILYIDDSIFIRLGYPLIGIKIALDSVYNFVFGIGGGNYRLEFLKAMPELFPDYYQTSREIMYNIRTLTATPKNIFVRIFVEGGLVGIALFLYGYYKNYIEATNYNKNNLILLLVLYLQFDSYIYLLFPMVLAMVKVYNQKNI